jgi:hypothetical protein
MQILEIVLYSHDGQKRVLPLKPGRTNIITGKSKTGKSALIDIVDYCLGRGECTIAEGKIRDLVAWFGLRLQFPTGQVFVARQAPPRHKQTTNRAYIEHGEVVESPATAPAEPNTTSEAIENDLTRKIGIAPNLHIPPTEHTREPLAANIRHALFYCFQDQNDIDTKNYLFHRQNEDFVPHAIKDTLPYFLGAIEEDRLALEQELARARRELKRAEQLLREAEAIKGEGISKAQGLLAEARHVGLLPDGEETGELKGIVELLQRVEGWSPNAVTFVSSEKLTQLQEEKRILGDLYEEKADAIRAVQTFAQEAAGYESEARKQELRLESIGLFDAAKQDAATCPMCSHHLNVPTPSAAAMQRSLQQLRISLDATTRERPRLREYIEGLEREREELKQRIRVKDEDINAILQEEKAAEQLRDLNIRRGHVAGRISLWLESVKVTDDTSQLKEEVERKQLRVDNLEAQLYGGEKEERLRSILNRLGFQMSQWAKELKLEHSESPVRLDLSKVTLIVDREDRPISLKHLGSGENWVIAHLITLFALHKHFRLYKRPVPQFLMLDQPSQVGYPADVDPELPGSASVIKDDAKIAVSRIYNFIFDVVESLAPDFQVIITDHADLAEDKFQNAVVEKWRGEKALVPQEWIEE